MTKKTSLRSTRFTNSDGRDSRVSATSNRPLPAATAQQKNQSVSGRSLCRRDTRVHRRRIALLATYPVSSTIDRYIVERGMLSFFFFLNLWSVRNERFLSAKFFFFLEKFLVSPFYEIRCITRVIISWNGRSR